MISKLFSHTVMGVPIVYREKIYGAIALMVTERERKLDHQDLLVAEEIGRKAGLALDNALLYRTAQKAIASRDEFLSIASHELKTPVTSLKLLLQMTRRSVDPSKESMPNPEKLASALDQANLQINRLTSLIDDLLDVSRIETGKIVYQFQSIDFSQLVTEICERYQEHLKSHGSHLSFSVQDNIHILGDRLRMEQVLLNLLTNAAKYGEKKPVHLQLSKINNVATLKVKDEGMGIPEDKLEKVFDRFERAVHASNISGLGLGLYISKEIVEAHMGKIWVESLLGRGSTFIIEIPIYLGEHK